VPQYGACFDNQQDSLARGAIGHCMHPVQLYHTPQNIAFLAFDGVVRDANGCGVVAMDWCFRLRMSQFFERHAENHSFFAI